MQPGHLLWMFIERPWGGQQSAWSSKESSLGHLGGSAVEHLPLTQGVTLGYQDRVPRRAPCMDPASPSACVSASLSLCLSWINKYNLKKKKKKKETNLAGDLELKLKPQVCGIAQEKGAESERAEDNTSGSQSSNERCGRG